MTTAPAARARLGDQGGLVLVCVLLVMALLTALCAGFARRALHTAPPVFAREQPVAAEWMQAMALPPAEALVQPSVGARAAGALPTLAPALMHAVQNDPGLDVTRVFGTTLWQDCAVRGLVVLAPGAVLYLDDVVIDGCLLSEAALQVGAPSASATAAPPRVVVDGDLRIEPCHALPGLAVLMPDGAMATASAGGALQFGGDVVVASLALEGQGALLGNVATLQPVHCAATIARPGEGRAPRAWSPALDLGDTDSVASVVFMPTDVSLETAAASREPAGAAHDLVEAPIEPAEALREPADVSLETAAPGP